MVIYGYMMVYISISGWWFQPTPLKNHGVKVSWDYDIPNIFWESHNPFIFQSPTRALIITSNHH
jgi:hypothetical protein